jgi:acyl-CoA carboxylase subunit beta
VRSVQWRCEWDPDLYSRNPLAFPGYRPPAASDESVRTGVAALGEGLTAVVIECSFDRYGGTMGAVAGEKIVRAFRRAAAEQRSVVALIASGGARLEEGIVSLMQMARTADEIAQFNRSGQLFVALFTGPTTGGVLASWASLADIRGARPGAVVGFSGPRVVKAVTGEYPPPTSHTADAAFHDGTVDALVDADEEVSWLARVLSGRDRPLGVGPRRPAAPVASAVSRDAWGTLVAARSAARPSGLEWAAWLTESWTELRSPDLTIRAGLATSMGRRVVVVCTDRHAYGDAAARQTPAGYRLARRAMRLAARLGLPLISIVDTPGADPTAASESAGIAAEIAETLRLSSTLPVPTVGLCVGEGGSGGAMALLYTDVVLILADSVFEVIGPEAGAAVLYKDADRAPDLASALRIRADDLYALGAVDDVIAAPSGDSLIDAVRLSVRSALSSVTVGARRSRAASATERSISGARGPGDYSSSQGRKKCYSLPTLHTFMHGSALTETTSVTTQRVVPSRIPD